jgi:hypothetical protein
MSLARLSGFPLDAFGAIMSDDHQIPPIYGASIRAAAERAKEARKEADRLACIAISLRAKPRNNCSSPALNGDGRSAMDPVTRCLHCSRRLVPVLTADGRTELKCLWCDQVDPMETEAAKWADSSLTETVNSHPFRGR